MIRLNRPAIKNSRGEAIALTPAEQYHAEWMERQIVDRHQNTLGYEIPITTLTSVQKRVTEQKFFTLPPADFLPVVVGENAWSTFLTAYRDFQVGDAFETGLVNMGGDDSRLATVTAAVDALTIQVYNWAKQVGWTIMELQQAAKSGNWDIVASKERARKKNWDLGIQRIAFLGLKGGSATCYGLLNQPSAIVNTTTITQSISTLGVAQLKSFCAQVLEDYRSNCQRTAWPTHFSVPESDHNGLASQASADFPIKSVKEVLEGTFKEITGNKNFKILSCAYGDKAYHADVAAIAGKQVYALYNGADEDTLRMDIPVDYTSTLQNSLNGFNMANVAYGQFSGVLLKRPLEVLYYQF